MRITMADEKERLLALLKDNKISKDDYQLLLAAIDKKPSRLVQFFFFAINPFHKIAGWLALSIGILILLAISYLGVIAKFYYPSVLSSLDALVVKNPKVPLNFFLLAYQNFVIWLLLTVIFFLVAKILKQRGIRAVDFFGTVALSRFPTLVYTAISAIVWLVYPAVMYVDINQGYPIHQTTAMALMDVFYAVCSVWQLAIYFFAFKVSSGLVGKKLYLSFIFSILLAETISTLVTSIFI